MDTAQLKKVYTETIAPALQKQFNYSSAMEIPVLKKIVINQGLGDATQDKKIVDVAINEITAITGQKAVATYSKKDIANFKLRKKMPIGVMVTLRRERMYEFLEKLVRVSLPRIRDFKGIESKFDGRGNYTLGITEQIIFPEINIDEIDRIQGMNITFVTTAKTDEEGFALLKAFGVCPGKRAVRRGVSSFIRGGGTYPAGFRATASWRADRASARGDAGGALRRLPRDGRGGDDRVSAFIRLLLPDLPGAHGKNAGGAERVFPRRKAGTCELACSFGFFAV